ncbi:uncharacterized protein LOC142338715 isoform X2 [Convolutriloba macropyga]|uniref:uncharacterized protein LOC142338715 isoform X2 n=1 Tax=Convolutriloba macropyga TaxID=536237 RepID=UPI003F528392
MKNAPAQQATTGKENQITTSNNNSINNNNGMDDSGVNNIITNNKTDRNDLNVMRKRKVLPPFHTRNIFDIITDGINNLPSPRKGQPDRKGDEAFLKPTEVGPHELQKSPTTVALMQHRTNRRTSLPVPTSALGHVTQPIRSTAEDEFQKTRAQIHTTQKCRVDHQLKKHNAHENQTKELTSDHMDNKENEQLRSLSGRRASCSHCYDPRRLKPTNWQFTMVPSYRQPECHTRIIEQQNTSSYNLDQDVLEIGKTATEFGNSSSSVISTTLSDDSSEAANKTFMLANCDKITSYNNGERTELTQLKKKLPVFHYDCQIEKVDNFLKKFDDPNQRKREQNRGGLNATENKVKGAEDTIDKVMAQNQQQQQQQLQIDAGSGDGRDTSNSNSARNSSALQMGRPQYSNMINNNNNGKGSLGLTTGAPFHSSLISIEEGRELGQEEIASESTIGESRAKTQQHYHHHHNSHHREFASHPAVACQQVSSFGDVDSRQQMPKESEDKRAKSAADLNLYNRRHSLTSSELDLSSSTILTDSNIPHTHQVNNRPMKKQHFSSSYWWVKSSSGEDNDNNYTTNKNNGFKDDKSKIDGNSAVHTAPSSQGRPSPASCPSPIGSLKETNCASLGEKEATKTKTQMMKNKHGKERRREADFQRAQPEANVQLTQVTKSLPNRGATSSGVSDRTIKFSGQMPTRKLKSKSTEERKKYNKTPLPHKTDRVMIGKDKINNNDSGDKSSSTFNSTSRSAKLSPREGRFINLNSADQQSLINKTNNEENAQSKQDKQPDMNNRGDKKVMRRHSIGTPVMLNRATSVDTQTKLIKRADLKESGLVKSDGKDLIVRPQHAHGPRGRYGLMQNKSVDASELTRQLLQLKLDKIKESNYILLQRATAHAQKEGII